MWRYTKMKDETRGDLMCRVVIPRQLTVGLTLRPLHAISPSALPLCGPCVQVGHQVQGGAGGLRRWRPGQQHGLLLRATRQHHRLPLGSLYGTGSPCLHAEPHSDRHQSVGSSDGTSLTDVANGVANANKRLIVFGNAQAEEIYNQGYPLIFGIGKASCDAGSKMYTYFF